MLLSRPCDGHDDADAASAVAPFALPAGPCVAAALVLVGCPRVLCVPVLLRGVHAGVHGGVRPHGHHVGGPGVHPQPRPVCAGHDFRNLVLLERLLGYCTGIQVRPGVRTALLARTGDDAPVMRSRRLFSFRVIFYA